MTDTALLAQEWQSLQADHEQYEKNALWIKITAVVLCFVSLAVVIDLLLAGVLIVVLWLQEAIVRTSQARVGVRLLQLEALHRQQPPPATPAFQLHSLWLANRGGGTTLIGEYLRNAVRPTVALPYAVLVLVLLAALSMPPG